MKGRRSAFRSSLGLATTALRWDSAHRDSSHSSFPTLPLPATSAGAVGGGPAGGGVAVWAGFSLWGPQRAQLLIDFQNSQIRPGIDCVSFLGSFHAYFSARGQIQSQHALSCAQPNPPKWGVQVG